MSESTARKRGRFGPAPLALFLALVLGCTAPEVVTDSRPLGSLEDVLAMRDRSDVNVLFVLVDTLRADRLGAYGYSRDTSPTIDYLAETGVRFGNQVAQSSWTKCSMSSLWTGLYPARTGVLRSQDAISPDARMPAEIMLDAGFRTAAIWRNAWIAPNFGFSQGFEIYHSPRAISVSADQRAASPGKISGSDADLIRSASEFLRAHADDRWFLYLHLMDVHQYVYDDDSALFGTGYSDSYDNSIHWVDSLLGRLFEELEKRDLRKRTLIVFAADHGEAFGEHGGEGHARNVYGEVTTTPFILSFPFRLEPNIVVQSRSANVDLWPTVLDLVGLSELDDPDGQSLPPAIEASARGEKLAEDDRPTFAQLDRTWARLRLEPQPVIAVNSEKWRLVYQPDRPDHSELFDKEADSAEQRNISLEQPEVVAALVREIDAHLENPSPPWGTAAHIEIDEMQMQQLRAIGYGVQ